MTRDEIQAMLHLLFDIGHGHNPKMDEFILFLADLLVRLDNR